MFRQIVRLGILMAAAPFSIGLAGGQSATAGGAVPRFDTASVKPVPYSAGEFRAVLGTALNGEVTLTDATMIECLRFAFGINNNFQIAGPDWIQSREYRFNIAGKAPPDTPAAQLRLMLQNLLTERFRMALHREQRELSFLALVVAKEGLKMQAAKDGSDPSGNAQIMGKIFSNSMSMTQLTGLLSYFLGQPVLDITGLQGWFDVKLQWPVEDAQAPVVPLASPPIFGALREQLGLALEPRQGPLEVIVVDHAEKTPVGH
ncbi:MAG: TIGR03435 family protein [Bryobacteraceae bacterium]